MSKRFRDSLDESNCSKSGIELEIEPRAAAHDWTVRAPHEKELTAMRQQALDKQQRLPAAAFYVSSFFLFPNAKFFTPFVVIVCLRRKQKIRRFVLKGH